MLFWDLSDREHKEEVDAEHLRNIHKYYKWNIGCM